MFIGKIHYQWPFSIAFCMFTRGYIIAEFSKWSFGCNRSSMVIPGLQPSTINHSRYRRKTSKCKLDIMQTLSKCVSLAETQVGCVSTKFTVVAMPHPLPVIRYFVQNNLDCLEAWPRLLQWMLHLAVLCQAMPQQNRWSHRASGECGTHKHGWLSSFFPVGFCSALLSEKWLMNFSASANNMFNILSKTGCQEHSLERNGEEPANRARCFSKTSDLSSIQLVSWIPHDFLQVIQALLHRGSSTSGWQTVFDHQ